MQNEYGMTRAEFLTTPVSVIMATFRRWARATAAQEKAQKDAEWNKAIALLKRKS